MGRAECMKILIKLNGDVAKTNATGSTPLHAASLNGYGESMEILIERGHNNKYTRIDERLIIFVGCDINQKNIYNYTAMNYADSNSRGHSPIYNHVSTLE
jgi:ankyrin repeat protein